MGDVLLDDVGKFYPGKGTRLKCENCGGKFFGRSDKKYCSSHCKNKKNNDRAKIRRVATSADENRMRKNYEILHQIYEFSNGKTELPIDMLRNKGFDFKAPSRIHTDGETGKQIIQYHGYGYSYNKKSETVIIYKI